MPEANSVQTTTDFQIEKGTSLWQDAFRRLRKNKMALLGFLFIGFVVCGFRFAVFVMEAYMNLTNAVTRRPAVPAQRAETWGTPRKGLATAVVPSKHLLLQIVLQLTSYNLAASCRTLITDTTFVRDRSYNLATLCRTLITA